MLNPIRRKNKNVKIAKIEIYEHLRSIRILIQNIEINLKTSQHINSKFKISTFFDTLLPQIGIPHIVLD